MRVGSPCVANCSALGEGLAHPKTAKTTHRPASASVPGGGVRAVELLKLLNPFLVGLPAGSDRAPASTTCVLSKHPSRPPPPLALRLRRLRRLQRVLLRLRQPRRVRQQLLGHARRHRSRAAATVACARWSSGTAFRSYSKPITSSAARPPPPPSATPRHCRGA